MYIQPKRLFMGIAAVVGTVVMAIAIVAAALHLLVGAANAQTLHSWSTGEVLRATDLNGNFTALKTGKVGSGVTLVNADVASNAAIAHSKLATPALVPKAWARVGSATCAASPCTVADSSQVTSIARTGAGVYTVTLAYTPANANFAPIPASHTVNVHCITDTLATAAPQITIRCYTDTTGAATDAAFSFVVMDS